MTSTNSAAPQVFTQEQLDWLPWIEPLDESELTAWFLARMASFKKPKKYVWRSDLPKNSYGKILKTDLRHWLQTASIAAL